MNATLCTAKHQRQRIQNYPQTDSLDFFNLLTSAELLDRKRSISPPCYAGLNVIADRLCGSNFSTSSGFVLGNAVST